MGDRAVSRRALLAIGGLGLASGCASDADKINSMVFGAVRKDPLFLWRPAWVGKVTDSETPLGGIYPQAAATLTHSLNGGDFPSTAIGDAIDVALAAGWQSRSDGIGYVKPITGRDAQLWVTFSQLPERGALIMIFSG